MITRNAVINCFYLLTLLVLPLSSFADDDNEQAGLWVVLDEEAQLRADIRTQPLKPDQYHSEVQVYGSVIELQDLLAARHQYQRLGTQLSYHQQHQGQLASAVLRLTDLYRQNATSKRKLQDQQFALYQLNAETADLKLSIQQLKQQFIADWGKELAEWFLSIKADELTQLVSGQWQIIAVDIPAKDQSTTFQNTISLFLSSKATNPYSVALLGRSPKQSQSGARYFFLGKNPQFRAGMRVVARLSESGAARKGYFIPETAVLWHLGKAYSYLKTAPEQFQRIALKQFQSTHRGYFIEQSVIDEDDDEIVVQGAQLLLSEEFKAHIPEEDDDD